jgi:hypothetical protein
MDRFNMSVSEYFEALVWEARNRELGEWPDVATYIQIRPYTGAVYVGFDLIELSEGQSLPLVVRKHPDFQRLMVLTSNVVCWCNDLFSLRKERAHGDMHNLALVLEHEEGITLQAAVERVAGLIERDVKGFMALVEALRSFGPETDDVVRCFVAGMRALMRGNLDWSAGSPCRQRSPSRAAEGQSSEGASRLERRLWCSSRSLHSMPKQPAQGGAAKRLV